MNKDLQPTNTALRLLRLVKKYRSHKLQMYRQGGDLLLASAWGSHITAGRHGFQIYVVLSPRMLVYETILSS